MLKYGKWNILQGQFLHKWKPKFVNHKNLIICATLCACFCWWDIHYAINLNFNLKTKMLKWMQFAFVPASGEGMCDGGLRSEGISLEERFSLGHLDSSRHWRTASRNTSHTCAHTNEISAPNGQSATRMLRDSKFMASYTHDKRLKKDCTVHYVYKKKYTWWYIKWASNRVAYFVRKIKFQNI